MRIIKGNKLVVASHNSGKVSEIRNLLEPHAVTVLSAADFDLDAPEETGTTFEENSAVKALAVTSATGLPALADDSGLCIDAIGGNPGVYTADWAELPDGEGRDFVMAMNRVHEEMRDSGSSAKSARFVAVLCLAWPDGRKEMFRGEVEGEIVWPPKGEKGFGYDPIFRPKGHDKTFGEMTAGEKHGTGSAEGLSHRARAFAAFASKCLQP